MESAKLFSNCKCGNNIVVDQRWTPGGLNDYGGFVLKCDKCGDPTCIHVGRDVYMSQVLEGATLLARYDDDRGDREATLQKYGLSKNSPG